jgi:hypothetical protein
MFGTDLNSAFSPFGADTEMYESVPSVQQSYQTSQPTEIVHKSTPISQIQQQPMSQQPMMKPSSMDMPTTLASPNNQDPKVAVLISELKKQQKMIANMEQQAGYFDKLGSKKKDVLRIIQLSLVIVLALSLHFVIDHYLKTYMKNNDLSFERELVLRLLYPLAVVFIIWNMKAFIK